MQLKELTSVSTVQKSGAKRSFLLTFIWIYNILTFIFLQKDECQRSSEEESCKSVKCHHHGSCAMKSISLKDDLTGNESDKDREENVVLEPYCKCPLGFHGQFCEKAVDVQVI